MKISIIIPTKNEENNINRLIRSILAHSNFKKDLEIIVVDNNSIDKTKEVARRLTQNVYNKGPERSSQRNFGAKKASGNILAFLDADMEITDTNLLNEISGIGNKIINNSYVIPEISKTKTKWDRYKAYYRKFIHEDNSIESPRVFSKTNFEKVGGYDEELNACEDWDLRNRIVTINNIERLNTKIIHHENIQSIAWHLKKKFYYATYLNKYLSKKSTKTISGEIIYFLRPSFYKMLKTIKKEPKTVAGSVFLITIESLAGFIGYVYGRMVRK